MANWLEKMQEQIDRENEAALRAYFHQLVDEGIFENTADTRMAFYRGWFGFIKFKTSKRDLTQAGQTSNLLAVMLWLLGGMLVGVGVVLLLTIPDDVSMSGVYTAWVISAGFAVLGYLAYRRSRRLARVAAERHRAKWGEKPVDE